MFFSQIIQIEARYITDSGAGYGKRIGYVPICVYMKQVYQTQTSK